MFARHFVAAWRPKVVLALALAVLALALCSATPSLAAASSPGLAAGPAAPFVIPDSKVAPTIDGYCREYTDALHLTYPDYAGWTGDAYLKHDQQNLYVCLAGAPVTFRERFASVYLDTDDGREAFAQADDLSLRATIPGSVLSSLQGSGVPNGYVPISLTGWTATATAGNSDQVEYAIPLNLTRGWCGRPFGLAVYHHWVTGVGVDFGWPSNKFFDQPLTWAEVTLAAAPCNAGKIAYVYRSDTVTAGGFKALLEAGGFTVQLVPLSAVLATDFAAFDLTIIADDTGKLDQWGTDPVQPAHIVSSGAGKPILGLGEGGYAFFGRLALQIGWPNGWHGPLAGVIPVSALAYYHTPYDLAPVLGPPLGLYTAPVNEVGIYLGPAGGVPPGTLVIGREPASPDHAPLIAEGQQGSEACRQLWGYSGGPAQMTFDARQLFVNAVVFGRSARCPLPPTPPPDCITVKKTSDPVAGTPVAPGNMINYTLTYQVASSTGCVTPRALLQDKLPPDTLFVPGSASEGIAPNAEGTLTWNLGPLAPGAVGSRSFKVEVAEAQCVNQQKVSNQAHLLSSLGTFDSNWVGHPVDCSPVVPPTQNPPYAEDDIQIYPYPLVTGHPTTVTVRLRNLSAVNQTVTVSFQTSPDRFGIGLGYTTLPVPGNPRVVTLPPLSDVRVGIVWTPVSSGHYCIQVVVQAPGRPPVVTQYNLDVAEDLRPGVEDVLTFSVGNPTPAVAGVHLVVVNTCPGWTAWVAPALLPAMAPGEVRTAQLHVTPPNPAVLGTACHIDVQGWIDGHLIGGIRKLDVPPINLPRADPYWAEKEITTIPDPPLAGGPNQVCVELQNPLGFPRNVTIDFAEADFGAGTPFTTFAVSFVTLPPHSLQKYCAPWTPLPGGTLDRCLRVTLEQAGFQDQRSQRNVKLVRPGLIWPPSGLRYPFRVANTEGFTRTLQVDLRLVGFVPPWGPIIDPMPPSELGPRRFMDFELVFAPMAAGAVAPAADRRAQTYGDEVGAEVAVLLDGEPAGGFTVAMQPTFKMFLPLIRKQ